MKRWIHTNEQIQASKKQPKTYDPKKPFNAKEAFNHFKSKYPKAYEVLGR